MSGLEIALIAFALMLLAIFMRVPVALAMGLTGFLGTWLVLGRATPMLSQMKTLGFDTFSNYSLSIVPMFLLMGNFATRSGMSAALFEAASDWIGHRKGGIAMAAVGGCAGFGAVCGSSLATASTMGQVALPEMRKRGVSDALATGVLAAGGTLGILIPPSVILVIYAILTEQNIVKMFMAALIPGVLAALGYMLTVAIYVRIVPDAAGRASRVPYKQRFKTLLRIWPVVMIFALVIGGIAADWDWSKPGMQALFTPTEGAAFGMVATGLYGIATGGLGWSAFWQSVLGAGRATAMIFLIVLGAQFFNSFLAFTQAPQMLAQWIAEQGYAPLTVLVAMLVIYVVLGCVMDSLSMILLSVPIFFPIIETLNFGLSPEDTAIWLITPPVGMNLFIINALDRDIPMSRTFAGVLPFVASDLLRVALLVAFPAITLWLVPSVV